MFGRKDKKGDRKRGREKEGKSGGGGGDLAGMFGLNMGAMPGTFAMGAMPGTFVMGACLLSL